MSRRQPSLLDLLGPWPRYLPALALLALVSFFVYYLPFAAADLVRRWRPGVGSDGELDAEPR